jgi:hypothetical protein
MAVSMREHQINNGLEKNKEIIDNRLFSISLYSVFQLCQSVFVGFYGFFIFLDYPQSCAYNEFNRLLIVFM